jgi:hypothetical protein
MDPTLAEIYGTNEELDKTAAAELAEELSDEEGLSLDGMDEDDLEQLAAEVLGSDDEDGEEVDEEGQEKLAEADYLGRVMAHSMVNELRGIEKQAKKSKKPGLFKRVDKGANKYFDKASDKVGKGAKWVKKQGRKASKFVSGSKFGKHVGKHRGLYAAGTAASAVGGGAYAAKKHFEKKASAFETLAEQRAMELIGDEGTEYDVLASAVEQRALEILSENGYEVE